ncbi:hypothetical protein E8E14_012221 [Neopestalotiopsis sp. 37M]|nr:hypothetical protein E8E14_012221 [Neopestalotiopsis sp. 37M]
MATTAPVETSTVGTLVVPDNSSTMATSSPVAEPQDPNEESSQLPTSDSEANLSHIGFHGMTNLMIYKFRLKPRDSEGSSKPQTNGKVTTDLKNYTIDRVEKSMLLVHSGYLKKIIRDVVHYYPGQNLIGEAILIKEPYAVLAHHADSLTSRLSSDDRNESASAWSDTEENHLRTLLNFMQSDVEPRYLPAEKRLKQSTPTVTFDDTWYLLRPGLQAYADINNTCHGCIIEKVIFEERDVKRATPRRWAVTVWFMDKIWTNNEVSPVFTTVYINTFDGECEVTSLSVYPCEYFDRSDDGNRRRHLEERGRRMQELIWKGHQLLQHDGELAWNSSSTLRLTGQVIVGSVNVHGIELPTTEWDFSIPKPQSQPPSLPNTKIRERLSYRLRPKNHGPEFLTQDLLFMMCPVHLAFVLSTKTWVLVNIDNTSEVDVAEVPPEPILDESSQVVIQALADYQLKEEKPWSADFIRNKGEGVVIMLHGPPGVGKTYTVESIALRMRRPLITLSIAEIGIKEDQVQAQLTKWFDLAEGWQAILLIDECDIFLERREAFDIARNGVVAAFLRNIEYFSGLLFLTTNRVGHIDEAFMSRVHAVIHFQQLNDASRKVLWKSLLDKVHRDRPGKISIATEAIEYLDSREMLQIDWNGREIRNAMQTALALAEREAKKSPYYKEGQPVVVLKAHFKAVQRLNKSFKDYLTSIREEGPIQRARNYYKRNDAFTAAITDT